MVFLITKLQITAFIYLLPSALLLSVKQTAPKIPDIPPSQYYSPAAGCGSRRVTAPPENGRRISAGTSPGVSQSETVFDPQNSLGVIVTISAHLYAHITPQLKITVELSLNTDFNLTDIA